MLAWVAGLCSNTMQLAFDTASIFYSALPSPGDPEMSDDATLGGSNACGDVHGLTWLCKVQVSAGQQASLPAAIWLLSPEDPSSTMVSGHRFPWQK